MAYQNEAIYFIESFIIIWVDAKLHHGDNFDDDTQNSIEALHHIANSIQLFDTSETCIDFIMNKIKDEKVFLIVSGSLGQQLVPQIEHDTKLDSIYIFCWDKLKHERWANKDHHHKIIGVFTDIRDVCNQLKEDIKHCQYELTSIQTLNSQTLKIVNHLDASFMYSQLLKEILLSMDQNDIDLKEAKDKFVDFCRIYYAKNSAELCVIEEFNQNYSNSSPIWWYTRECFTYSMLNRALGVQDVEILIKMSFFICDLHRQLEHLHQAMNHREILTVYRGQGMLHAAFHRLKQNQGGLISFNNFLSTSTSKDVSLCFAEKAFKKPGKIAILFEMTIDPSISSVPFASLDKFSYFQDKEQEILFSMHTIFRIGEITLLDNDSQSQIWHVHLTSTNADDEQLHQLTEHMRMELCSCLVSKLEINMDPTWRLSKLLIHMGEYDKAVIIYDIMLDKATRENNLELVQAIYYQMGETFMIYSNDWNRAKENIKKFFSIKMPDGSAVFNEAQSDMVDIFSTMSNLIMREQLDENEFHSIMAELLNKVVILYRNYPAQPLGPLDYQLIADRYNYIGWVRRNQGKLSEAWTNHHQALEILNKYLPPTHPRLALTYNHIGVLHSAMDNHLSALDCLEKALKIQEKALQPYHSHLAETHYQLSIIFEHLNKVDEAFQHAKKAVDISHHAFSSHDPKMIQYQEQYNKILLLTQSYDELVL